MGTKITSTVQERILEVLDNFDILSKNNIVNLLDYNKGVIKSALNYLVVGRKIKYDELLDVYYYPSLIMTPQIKGSIKGHVKSVDLLNLLTFNYGEERILSPIVADAPGNISFIFDDLPAVIAYCSDGNSYVYKSLSLKAAYPPDFLKFVIVDNKEQLQGVLDAHLDNLEIVCTVSNNNVDFFNLEE